jgi:hypothetical protein
LLAARAHQSQGELLKAHAAFTQAVAEAKVAARSHEHSRQTLQEAQNELKDLEGVLARLTIRLRHAPEGTRVTIDGEPVAAEKVGQPILLPPGQVKVVAQTQDGREASRSPTLTAGQDAKIELAFVREDSPEAAPVAESEPEASEPSAGEVPVKGEASSTGNGKRSAAFIAGGVGVAGLATFGVLGAMSNAKYNDLDDACPSARCSSDQQSRIDDGKLYQTLANVGLIVGIAGVGTSVTLFVLSSSGASEQKAARLELRAGLRSLELRGRFE